MRRRSLLLVLPLALAVATYAPKPPRLNDSQSGYGGAQPPIFRQWLAQVPGRAAEFADFERFLVREKVDGVLPNWSLLWVDRHLASPKCPTEPFMLPPKSQWPKLVPTLNVIRDDVQPAIGQVEVVSGYRTQDFNRCIGGASRSAHLQFGALDLIPVTPAKAPHEPYKSLCRMWRASPSSLRIGLGAYYDPDDRVPRSRQRFHIDTFGKRTWGFGYGSQSSFCLDQRSQ